MGGGRIIKDATAFPGDVAAGKIFYNNNGRQTGEKELPPFEVKTFALLGSNFVFGNYSLNNNFSVFRENGLNTMSGSVTFNCTAGFNMSEHTDKKFVGISLNGIFYKVPFSLPHNAPMLIVLIDLEYTGKICITDRNIYASNGTEDMNITFYYYV